ncbi:sister chromatid cohesion 1 protein 3-like isoform X1 [Magnolia sinica]|uniref:sister chromatid cohesion 1 protein 3-like isoform X1 n=1 Tax=Magnolia sinica TaxID=86752 RepID=UPI00265AEE9C|nr:sister chromatid cohesion 1 protein 3-like isoform X1 [Magnolia sinica]XP_058071136.1 sister chromatid cohesion 1 protein 3-like isoform X1 [Magnolia sinica]
MFYSHTFLARKGPLGTVWIAAHLQNKLQKSQVAVTDISASADYIMFPEVPIALRLSGHLLLGVVRIYSKKVDYLYHDCNMVLIQIRSAFASEQVNLPEDARHALFHSITLPKTFELDALDLDDAILQAEAPDNHLKAREDITITDQVMGEENPYVAFFINEGSMVDPYQTELHNVVAEPMDEDILLPFPRESGAVGIQDPGPSSQAEESNQEFLEDQFPRHLPEIEILRDAVQPFELENLPEWPNLADNIVEQREPFDPIMNQKESLSPIVEGFLDSGGESLPSQPHLLEPTARSIEEPEIFYSNVSLGPVFSEMAIQPTPLEKQKAKSRKRKQLFDESLVLTNEFMKKQLKHASKLKRKRESLPVTKLDIWKSDKSLQMEQIFFEPSVSGMCTNLQEVFKKDFLASKADSTSTKAHLEPRDAQSPTGMPTFEMENEHPPMNAESPAGIPVFEMEIELPPRDAHSPVGLPECEVEIEHPRFKEVHVDGGLPEFMPSPSRREEFTPFLASNFGSMSQTGKTLETEALHTPEMPFAQSDGLELETPVAGFEELLSAGDTNLPEIPNVLNSAEAEGLCFLEADTTEAGNEENEVGMLPTMTRAVAQYLKKKFFTSNFKRPIRSSQLE